MGQTLWTSSYERWKWIRIGISIYICIIATPLLAQPMSTQMTFPRVKWEKITTHKGIHVFQGDRSNSPLPLLKGQTQLPLNLYEIMAVVEDAKKHPSWVYRMGSSTIFERPDPFHLKAYVRFDFPWPSSDRDAVLNIEVIRKWTPHHEVWVYFQKITHPRYPESDECVRAKQSRGRVCTAKTCR